jgi:hypothetical protein
VKVGFVKSGAVCASRFAVLWTGMENANLDTYYSNKEIKNE